MKPLLVLRLRILGILSLLVLSGCLASTKPPKVPYDPQTFRVDIALLIAQNKYRDAVALVQAADVERQLAADGTGYMVIAEDGLVLPGIDIELKIDRNRDWIVPGTSDVVEDAEWQRVAKEFATQYNQRRRSLGN